MSQLVLRKISNIETPIQGRISIYVKLDGNVYAMDENGREILLSNTEVSLLSHIADLDAHPQYLKKANSRKIEYVTITEEHLRNKKIILDKIPINPHFVQADLKNGGGALFFQEDFIVEGREFSWNNLTLDGCLEIDDKIRLVYDHQ